jgi:hypothetical protein
LIYRGYFGIDSRKGGENEASCTLSQERHPAAIIDNRGRMPLLRSMMNLTSRLTNQTSDVTLS